MADQQRSELVVSALELALADVARARSDPPLRPGLPVHRSAVRKALRQGGNRDLDGLGRRLLRQRRLRNVPRDPEEGADLPAILADARRGQSRDLRVHRGLVQPAAPALHARLPLPDRVRATPHRARPTGARDSISANGSIGSLSPRASDGLTTRRVSTAGVDFVGQPSISPENATVVQPVPLRPRRTPIKGRTATGGLSDL